MEYCLSFLKDNGQFQDMFDYIHIDEKWFYIAKIKQKFYLLPEESEPSHQVSKSNIVKVMFLAAIRRIHFDFYKKQYFDWKTRYLAFRNQRTSTAKQQKSPKRNFSYKICRDIKNYLQTNVNKQLISCNKRKMASWNENYSA